MIVCIPTYSLPHAARLVVAVALVGVAAAALAAEAVPVRERLTAESVFSRTDVNQDGRLSRAEVARYPAFSERFDQLDSSRDGVLDLAEFAAGFNAPQ